MAALCGSTRADRGNRRRAPAARSIGLAKPHHRAHIFFMLGGNDKTAGAPMTMKVAALPAAGQGEHRWR